MHGLVTALIAFVAKKMSPNDPSPLLVATTTSKDRRILSMSPSPFAALDHAAATADTDENAAGHESPQFKISLWLLPPGGEESSSSSSSSPPLPSIRSQLQSNINEIATSTGGPKFEPHVTILGGIPCLCATEQEADRWAAALLQELQARLPSVGGIPCKFGRDNGKRPVCVFESGHIIRGDNFDSDTIAFKRKQQQQPQEINVKWNQSCVSVMDRCDQFSTAVKLTYEAVCEVNRRLDGGPDSFLGDETAFDWKATLKPPIFEPHYSHAYGNNPGLVAARRGGDEDEEEEEGGEFLTDVPPDFVSQEAMLIWTCPAELECVETWREVGRVRLS
mmetsp:Transcript_27302/g.59764  ORF Transcript_27302/g.59764 Transcript_27302/m.59764 type:complete len:334 (+) Transcript_27302:58-1059(+)